MLLFVSAKCFARILSTCARYFISIPTISAVFSLQTAVRVHAIVVSLFYGIFIGIFSISDLIIRY